MRQLLIFILACVVICQVPPVRAQELVWRARMENESTVVSHNTFAAHGEAGNMPMGVPVAIGWWRAEEPIGYACRLMYLERSGILDEDLGPDEDVFDTFPSPSMDGWRVPDRHIQLGISSKRLAPSGAVSHAERNWQIADSLYALRSGTETMVYDSSTCKSSVLAPEAGFVEIARSRNGVIAMTALRRGGIVSVLVYDDAGMLIWELSGDDVDVQMCDLFLSMSGEFIEYSVIADSRSPLETTTRHRVFLDGPAEGLVDVPLPGGTMLGAGFDYAIWTQPQSATTRVMKLNEQGQWSEAYAFSERAIFGAPVSEKICLISLYAHSADGISSVFFDEIGEVRLELPCMHPFRVSRTSANLVAVQALGETALVWLRAEGDEIGE